MGFAHGVGASVERKEDDRFLRGRGRFVGDLKCAGMLEMAFVRSPLAHARITRIVKPAGADSRVFSMDDLAGVGSIVANSALAGFKSAPQPPLARDKVRHVGEAVAACLAETRAQAEDLAEQVELDLVELPAVHDMIEARAADSPRVHDHWPDNVVLETRVAGDIESVKGRAAAIVRRRLRTARQCMSPLEGRGVLAEWDTRLDQLTLHTSTQMPHIVRSGLSEVLGWPQEQIRVVAPDVGGGFGYKGILLPEEIVAAYLARKLGRPIRWIEDRREQLAGNANCREHDYDITAYADADGRLLAVDCEAHVDAGAWSIYPFSACLEAAQVASILPGPYKMEAYRCRTWSMATNKPGIVPYRGVARAGVCYAIESVMDDLAVALGMNPVELRLRNLPGPEAMPFTNITNKYFDSGDYPVCLRRAVAALDRSPPPPGPNKRRGVGVSIFCEQAAHGTSVYHGWGIPMVPGHEQAVARMTPDGGLEIRVGIQSHGQGLETTLAQVAHQILGVPLARIQVLHGDTGVTPYSTGTWGSRCMVMAGGAVAAACKELVPRLRRIGAHLLQAPEDQAVLEGGFVRAGGAELPLSEVARTWYRAPQSLPADVSGAGLEAVAGYRAKSDTGTFSYAAHAVVVEVDLEFGEVRLVDYAICEDGGVLVNPMIVDGQVIGGVAQGIGTALYEEMPFDAFGQPGAVTLADYVLPGATEVPSLRIAHMETPSPLTEFGQKGIGEGGAIGPPAAIACAVNDALRPLGARIDCLPITPARVLVALAEAAR